MKKFLFFFLLMPLQLFGQIHDLSNADLMEKYYPYKDDIQSLWRARSGNYLIDVISGDTATILVPEFINDQGAIYFQGNTTRDEEKLLDGQDYTIYFRHFQPDSCPSSPSTLELARLGSDGVGDRGIKIAQYYRKPRIYISDGTNNEAFNLGATGISNDTILDLDYVDILIQIDSSAGTIKGWMMHPNGDTLESGSDDISAFSMSSNANDHEFQFYCESGGITNFKKFNDIVSISNCLNDSYTDSLQIHYPSLLGKIDISGNGCHLISGSIVDSLVVYEPTHSWMLDYGYDNYPDLDSTQVDINVPYQTTGQLYTSADWAYTANTPLSGFRIFGEFPGNQGIHNFYDSKIRFTDSFFDRSDTDIWADSCRNSSYYDASNTKDFHISELNQRTLHEYLKDTSRGKLYVNAHKGSVEWYNRDYIEEILLYTSDHDSLEHGNILSYTGDYTTKALDSSDAVVYDTDGYVKLGTFKSSKPMLTIRFDDAYRDCYSDWYPTLDTMTNVVAVTCAHPGLVGTSTGGKDYMGWDSLVTLENDGWEILHHNYTNTDYAVIGRQDSIEIWLQLAVDEFEAQGLDVKNWAGNKHSASNHATWYFAEKYGFNSFIGWGAYGDNHGANPAAINLYWMSAIMGDLSDPYDDYYLLDADPSEEVQAIKDEIDTCVSGDRWLIIMLHAYGAHKEEVVEVIQYAQSQGVDIVTIQEGLNNCKYME